LTTSFDPAPVSQTYPAGTFTIVAGFDNVSTFDICNPFFQVVELSPGPNNELASIWIEPGGPQIQGAAGYPVSLSSPRVAWGTGSSIQFKFVVHLRTTDPFRFLVNVLGTVPPSGSPCQ
jgi:hypothetical protein